MRRRCVAALTIVACLMAASCGESTGSTAPPDTETSTSAPPSAEERLADQMLSLSDLPAGWSVDRHENVTGADPCSLSMTSDAPGSVQREERYVGAASGLPAAGEVLISLPTVTAARAFFVESAGSGPCFSESALPPGATSAPSLSEESDAPVYSFLTATDEGEAFRSSETTTADDGLRTTVGIDRLLARRGRIVALVYLAEQDDADWNVFAQLANKAVDKITERETTAEYAQADGLCRTAQPLTPGATSIRYAGVTTYSAILGNPVSFNIPDQQSTRAFLAVCSYAGDEQPLIRVYVDAAGHRYEPLTSF